MPETAKERGMEVNDIVDERYDLENQHREPVVICYAPKEKFGI
jgi:hypothetical protein